MRFLALLTAAGLLAAATPPPGIVVDYVPAGTNEYVGSPSLAILPDNTYVASHDLFGGESDYKTSGLTRLFRSRDRGAHWDHLADITDAFWSTLFVHRGKLYLIGTTKEYGNTVIRRSDDGGETWTEPKTAQTGLLLEGAYHCAPQPVVVHNGRIWRGMEDAMGGGGWGKHFRAFMMSAPIDSDLLNAASWTSSNRLARDASWLNGTFNGFLEGNAVVTPAKELVDILRVDTPTGGKAAMLHISSDGQKASFDPAKDFIDLPGGAKKFTIRWDEKSKLYWSLSNYEPPKYSSLPAPGTRNTLTLISSPDLRTWTIRTIVLHHPDRDKHAFQYVDWLPDGADMVFVARTAWGDGDDAAHNAHDANYLTFHRLQNFRQLTIKDSAFDPSSLGMKP